MTRQDTLRMAIHSELAPYDAFSGPAYGDRNMPFIIGPAVGAASAAIGVAAATTTLATVGAAALATVGAIGAIATVAGLAMSVIGMATGNKELSKIGMYVGLAGGVASLATWGVTAGLNAASSSFEAATSAASAAQASSGASGALSGITHAGDAYTAGQAAGAGLTNTAGATTGAIAETSNAANAAGALTNAPSEAVANSPTALGGNLNATNSATNTLGQTAINTESKIATNMSPALPNTGVGVVPVQTAPLSQQATTASSFFSKLTDNPTALMVGGQALSGLYQGNAKKQENAITQQQNAYNQGVTSMQINNASHPASWGYTAVPRTAQQKSDAQVATANKAKEMAGILTA